MSEDITRVSCDVMERFQFYRRSSEGEVPFGDPFDFDLMEVCLGLEAILEEHADSPLAYAQSLRGYVSQIAGREVTMTMAASFGRAAMARLGDWKKKEGIDGETSEGPPSSGSTSLPGSTAPTP